MAVASAGPYASLHLASDRQPRQHPTTQFFTGRTPFLPAKQQRQSTTNEYTVLYQRGCSCVRGTPDRSHKARCQSPSRAAAGHPGPHSADSAGRRSTMNSCSLGHLSHLTIAAHTDDIIINTAPVIVCPLSLASSVARTSPGPQFSKVPNFPR